MGIFCASLARELPRASQPHLARGSYTRAPKRRKLSARGACWALRLHRTTLSTPLSLLLYPQVTLPPQVFLTFQHIRSALQELPVDVLRANHDLGLSLGMW